MHMSQTGTSTKQQRDDGSATRVDMKLEVDIIPVSDVERSKQFYKRLGWRFDDDAAPTNGIRIVQFTPPSSRCSVTFGKGLTAAAPGSAVGALIVSDIEAAHAQPVARGIDASEVWLGAQEFDKEGARVAICGLNEKTLKAAQETLGAGSLAVRADVSNLADLDAMFTTIKREFGHLDGIFVNAGHSEFLPFEEVTEQSFDRVIGSNFKGAYFTIQKALPLLRQGSSVIINASVTARRGWPTTSTVSPCKAAVVNLARILSSELVDRGIRVNTLSPGPTDTAMFGRFSGEEQGDAVKGLLRTNNPSKRLADPVEIAKLAVYLASDDSAYVVGADFLIDGGATAISAVGA